MIHIGLFYLGNHQILDKYQYLHLNSRLSANRGEAIGRAPVKPQVLTVSAAVANKGGGLAPRICKQILDSPEASSHEWHAVTTA